MPALPNPEDVRHARKQAEAGVSATFEAVRSPVLAALGAVEAATKTVTEALGKVRDQATGGAEEAQTRVRKGMQELRSRVSDLSAELGELRHRLEPGELRKLAEEYSEAAQQTYASLVERGEEAFGELRSQPRVRQALDSVESGVDTAQERLERVVGDVNTFVDELRTKFARISRSAGERLAKGTEDVAIEAAQRVQDVAGKAQGTADQVSETVSEAGAEAAATTRSTTHKVAEQSAPPDESVAGQPGDTTRKG